MLASLMSVVYMFDNDRMAFFTDLDTHLAVLRDVVGADVEAAGLPGRVVGVCDEDVTRILTEATAVISAVEALRVTAAGVASARSRREMGHGGFSAGSGHANAASLVQEVTGSTKAEANRHVRLGEALLDGANLLDGRDTETDPDAGPAEDDGVCEQGMLAGPWHAGLGRAQLAGVLSLAQHSAIRRGLGEPPVGADATADAGFTEAWSAAAEQLINEAAHRTVEELAAAARLIRDRLDPVGAEARFDARFQARSFRMWTDGEGTSHGRFVFDDEAAAWLRTVIDSALRPRRGGPRFVDAEEKKRAEDLAADPRSNEQLTYDLMFDAIRAGTLADAKTVFGTRQAAVRVVVTADALATAETGGAGVAHTEDGLHPLPAWLAVKQVCESGTRTLVIDEDGEPLRLGREQRLYSPAQRIALAVRDGGCRWTRCDRPASMCEAHHIDPYSAGGSTDVDRGILLCRFHHMQLHHNRWHITRTSPDDFLLHPPPGHGDPTVLPPRLGTRNIWSRLHPPPARSHPAA